MARPSKIQFDNDALKNALSTCKDDILHLSDGELDDEQIRKVHIFLRLNPVEQSIYYLYSLHGGSRAALLLGVSRTYVYKIVKDANEKINRL